MPISMGMLTVFRAISLAVLFVSVSAYADCGIFLTRLEPNQVVEAYGRILQLNILDETVLKKMIAANDPFLLESAGTPEQVQIKFGLDRMRSLVTDPAVKDELLDVVKRRLNHQGEIVETAKSIKKSLEPAGDVMKFPDVNGVDEIRSVPGTKTALVRFGDSTQKSWRLVDLENGSVLKTSKKAVNVSWRYISNPTSDQLIAVDVYGSDQVFVKDLWTLNDIHALDTKWTNFKGQRNAKLFTAARAILRMDYHTNPGTELAGPKAIAISRDGKRAYVAVNRSIILNPPLRSQAEAVRECDAQILVFDLETGKRLQLITFPGKSIETLRLIRNDRSIVFTSANDRPLVTSFELPDESAGRVPESKLVHSALRLDAETVFWFVVAQDGTIAWSQSANDRWIARIQKAARAPIEVKLPAIPDKMAFSEDAKLLAITYTARMPGHVGYGEVYSAETGETVGYFGYGIEPGSSLSFTEDGKSILAVRGSTNRLIKMGITRENFLK